MSLVQVSCCYHPYEEIQPFINLIVVLLYLNMNMTNAFIAGSWSETQYTIHAIHEMVHKFIGRISELTKTNPLTGTPTQRSHLNIQLSCSRILLE